MAHTLTNYNGVQIVTPNAELSADRQALNGNFEFLADNCVRNPLTADLDAGGFDIADADGIFAQGYGFEVTEVYQAAHVVPNNYVLATNAAIQTPEFTVCGWFRMNANNTFTDFVSYSNNSGGWIIRPQDRTSLTFYVFTSSGLIFVRSAIPTLGQWVHYALTYDGTTLTGYVNGTPLGTATGGSALWDTTELTVGYDRIDDYYSTGDAQEIQIYNAALDATQIAEIYNGGAGHYGIPAGISGALAGYHLNGDTTDFVGANNASWSGTAAYVPGVIAPAITPTPPKIEYDESAIQLLDNTVVSGSLTAQTVTATSPSTHYTTTLASDSLGCAGRFTDGTNTATFANGASAITSTGHVKMQGLQQGSGPPATILTNFQLYVDTNTGIVYCT